MEQATFSELEHDSKKKPGLQSWSGSWAWNDDVSCDIVRQPPQTTVRRLPRPSFFG